MIGDLKTVMDCMGCLKLVMNVDTADFMASNWEEIAFSVLMSHDFPILD